MNIKEVQINNFGKLKDKKIEFKKGINVVFGENESGKSTLLKFITGMFYGISKNKNGKRNSDYERFSPWNAGEYSGKMIYELDNKDEFEIYRNFIKKNPQILDKSGNDVSKKYNIDKTLGNQFFIEQTKVDEELFNMTLTMKQQEVQLDEKKQNSLMQKLSNIMLTGEDDVSFKKVLDRLEKRQTEDIGTDKSPTKPLFLIKKRIEELVKEKQELENILPIKRNIDNEKSKIENQIYSSEKDLEIMQEMQKCQDEIRVDEETIKINNKSKEELEIKKEEEENKLDDVKSTKYRRKSYKILYIIPLLLTIVSIIFIILQKITVIISILGMAVIGFIAAFALNISENKKYRKIKDEEKSEINKITNKIEIIENEIKEKEKLIEQKEQEISVKKNSNKAFLKTKYSEIKNIDALLLKNVSSQNILEKQKLINDQKLKIGEMELQKNELMNKLENKTKIEEELENSENELKELLEYNDVIEMAIESLRDANKKMKDNITPKLAKNLSSTINTISGGKYKNIKANEEIGLIVETENGNYVPADLLSVGTIDQLFLSLRISNLNEITKENMPIILDETFAYFDEKRLENILKYLNDEYKDRQILILTCTDREIKALKQLSIKYNYIEL